MGEALEGLTGSGGAAVQRAGHRVCSAGDRTGRGGDRWRRLPRQAHLARRLLEALDGLGRPVQKILIVDDEPDALHLFSRMLSEAARGYRVNAANGKQALQLLGMSRRT